ncbi:unnamed protein product [Heterobilharzia americana]|nr:unnamed protein product [Heterobilharzia americana]
MEKPFGVTHGDLQDAIQEFITDLIDSCLMDDILTMHRAIKLGYFHIIASEPNPYLSDSAGCGSSNTGSGRDLNKTTSCCRCGKCNCKVAATRYAAHLSNCMGLGRNSSRRANKRIAEQQRLEDDDTETEDIFLESSGDMITHKSSVAASEQFECKYSNGTINRHQSPLKLTISLVSSNSGKSDHSLKHPTKQVESVTGVDGLGCSGESNSVKPVQS